MAKDPSRKLEFVTLVDASLGQTIASLNDKFIKEFGKSSHRKALLDIISRVLRDDVMTDKEKLERLGRLIGEIEKAAQDVS